MFALSVTTLKIAAVEMFMTLTFKWSPVKSKYDNQKAITIISYLMAIVMLPLSVKILAVKMCITLNLTFKWVKVTSKYVDRKHICDYIFDGNSNVAPPVTILKLFIVEMDMTVTSDF